ncbi:FAD-binding oxidoreductase [Paenirhodobacter hankyongi]|uniref:FAD-binding oxidoreductase n=1 Tax=Paenirhodobacter hankyongi TaxID=2294033 RepID=A0A421BJ33_9RHOB|nr:FAD-binding oxidoreductase [Sinirhodobacter hankyongi]RLL61426.1 FAD-binding oxidoreductase [Sinirhodobacter hankyongi]
MSRTPLPSPDTPASSFIDATVALAAGISALGADIRLLDETDLAGRDPGSHPLNFGAGLLAMPGNTEALQALMRLCAERGVPIVPHGGRTGLVGGTISRPGSLALSTARMNRILDVDPLSRTALVEAGVTLQALQSAAAEHGFEPGIDLGARGTATIGGMAATNAGGIQAFRHGVMRHRVLGLEAVLADGTLYSDLSRVVKSTSGYDLKQLFIGSEGTLGVITRVVVQLTPLPKARATALLALPDTEAGLSTARKLLTEIGGDLLACEIMWGSFLEMNRHAQGTLLPDSFAAAPASLLIEIAGPDDAAAQSRLDGILAALWDLELILDAVVATSETRRTALWHLREDMSVFEAAYPGHSSFDVSLPPSRIADWLPKLDQRLSEVEPGLTALVFAHIADGNLHIIPRRGDCGPEVKARIGAAILSDLIPLGGAISAEHGIGEAKRAAFETFVPHTKRDLMARVKAALDPEGLLNPGKILPVPENAA